MFGSLGIPELLIILVIVALLFGGRKLPELGKGLGQAIRHFKDGLNSSKSSEDKSQEKKDEKTH